MSHFNSPFMLGFDQLERTLDRMAKSANDGYPPYNVELIGDDRLCITLAVAGFGQNELSITVEDQQLVIRGRQQDDAERVFLHRGIAARQFQKSFLLADGIEVVDADLSNGMLMVNLHRPKPSRNARQIKINGGDQRHDAIDVS